MLSLHPYPSTWSRIQGRVFEELSPPHMSFCFLSASDLSGVCLDSPSRSWAPETPPPILICLLTLCGFQPLLMPPPPQASKREGTCSKKRQLGRSRVLPGRGGGALQMGEGLLQISTSTHPPHCYSAAGGTEF